jgi:hypothetical protein
MMPFEPIILNVDGIYDHPWLSITFDTCKHLLSAFRSVFTNIFKTDYGIIAINHMNVVKSIPLIELVLLNLDNELDSNCEARIIIEELLRLAKLNNNKNAMWCID